MAGLLAGKVAVITGAGRGIGRAVAAAYAQEGTALALCSRTGGKLTSAAGELERLGAEVLARETDVSRPDQVATFVEAALGKFGHLDVLVNNAGVAHPQVSLLKCPIEEWDRVLAINLRGAYLVARTVAPHMVRQKRGGALRLPGLGRLQRGHGSGPRRGELEARDRDSSHIAAQGGSAMATVLFVVKASITRDQEAAFNHWYDTEHVPQLLQYKGAVSARRYRAIMGEDRYQYMAVYEFESEETFQRFLDSDHLVTLKKEYDVHFGTVSERVRSAYVQVWP